MKNYLLVLIATVFLFSNCNTPSAKKADVKVASKDSAACCDKGAMNMLTDAEKAQNWILMFDGKTSDGWRGYNKKTFPAGWKIEDGALKCQGSGRGEAGAIDGGDIIFDRKFSNFDLKLEWKISEGGNSGIFYLAKEIEGWEIYRSAPEMQVLDNDRHPDAMLGKDGNRKAGSLYDIIPAKPQNTKPAGQWNSVEIISYQGTVVHKQNGETILEYHLWTPEWNALVKVSKFPGLNPDWANVAKEGFIGFQDHGSDVWYRNIKIRTL